MKSVQLTNAQVIDAVCARAASLGVSRIDSVIAIYDIDDGSFQGLELNGDFGGVTAEDMADTPIAPRETLARLGNDRRQGVT